MNESSTNTFGGASPGPTGDASAAAAASAVSNLSIAGQNILTDFTTPLFQSMDPNFDNQQNNVDLDDLFRECYFIDFPMPNMTLPPGMDVDQQASTNTNEEAPHNTATMSSGGGNHSTTATATTAAPVLETVTSNGGASAASPSAATPMVVPSSHDSTALVPSSQQQNNSNKRSADDMSNTEELTDQQRLERRERNREHAKRSRLRKKFLLESLQEQIQGLQEQLDAFKDVIKRELPQQAEGIIQTICGDKTKFTPLPCPSGFGPVKTLMEPDFRLMSALSGSQQNFAISDPSLPDNPIVYVSQGFLDLTGYALDQVLGRNCRLLQGPGTDQSAVEVIRKGINEGVDTSVCLLNYKADGTPFWNQFVVAALRDAENNVVNYVGVR